MNAHCILCQFVTNICIKVHTNYLVCDECRNIDVYYLYFMWTVNTHRFAETFSKNARLFKRILYMDKQTKKFNSNIKCGGRENEWDAISWLLCDMVDLICVDQNKMAQY